MNFLTIFNKYFVNFIISMVKYKWNNFFLNEKKKRTTHKIKITWKIGGQSKERRPLYRLTRSCANVSLEEWLTTSKLMNKIQIVKTPNQTQNQN